MVISLPLSNHFRDSVTIRANDMVNDDYFRLGQQGKFGQRSMAQTTGQVFGMEAVVGQVGGDVEQFGGGDLGAECVRDRGADVVQRRKRGLSRRVLRAGADEEPEPVARPSNPRSRAHRSSAPGSRARRAP